MDSYNLNLIKDLNNNHATGKSIKLERHTMHTIDTEEFVINELFASENEINIVSTNGRYIELSMFFIEDMERFEDAGKVLYSYWLDGAEYTISMDMVA